MRSPANARKPLRTDGQTDGWAVGRTCRKTVTVGRMDQRTHVQVKRGYFRLQMDGWTTQKHNASGAQRRRHKNRDHHGFVFLRQYQDGQHNPRNLGLCIFYLQVLNMTSSIPWSAGPHFRWHFKCHFRFVFYIFLPWYQLELRHLVFFLLVSKFKMLQSTRGRHWFVF